MKIPEGVDLIDFTNDYKDKTGVTNEAIAAPSGVSRPLISRYLNKNYTSKGKTAEEAIIKYFESIDEEEKAEILEQKNAEEKNKAEQSGTETAVQEQESKEQTAETEAEEPKDSSEHASECEDKASNEEKPVVKKNRLEYFYESRDAATIVAICSLCQESAVLAAADPEKREKNEYGVITGKPGYGKTYTLKQYAKRNRVCYVECDDSMTSRDLIDAICLSIGLPGSMSGTVWRKIQAVKDFFNVNVGYLLIIDEADKLLTKYSAKKMEIIRAIFDQCEVGLVLAGEPALADMLKVYLPRFMDRAAAVNELVGLNEEEIRDYLRDFNADEEALGLIINRGLSSKAGCFRRLDRVLRNVLRIKRDGSVITKKDLEAASSLFRL